LAFLGFSAPGLGFLGLSTIGGDRFAGLRSIHRTIDHKMEPKMNKFKPANSKERAGRIGISPYQEGRRITPARAREDAMAEPGNPSVNQPPRKDNPMEDEKARREQQQQEEDRQKQQGDAGESSKEKREREPGWRRRDDVN
jgi:hypothetical protein